MCSVHPIPFIYPSTPALCKAVLASIQKTVKNSLHDMWFQQVVFPKLCPGTSLKQRKMLKDTYIPQKHLYVFHILPIIFFDCRILWVDYGILRHFTRYGWFVTGIPLVQVTPHYV